MDVKKQIIDLL